MKKILISILILLINCSPARRMESKLYGLWIIEESRHNGRSNLFNYLGNTIIFNSNNTCELPVFKPEDANTDKQKGIWSIHQNSNEFILHINTKNNLFNNQFLIEFNTRRQGDAILKVITLKTENIHLECSQ